MASSDDFPSNPTTTGQLVIGGSATGNFETGRDVDWYGIDLQADTRYLFTLKTLGNIPYSMGYHAYAVRVYDAQGKVVSLLQDGGDADAPVLEFTPHTSGHYYVAATEIYPWYGLGGYQLSAAIRTGGDDLPADSSTALVLADQETVGGKFEVAGDRDWIKFHAVPGVHYEFTALGPNLGDPPSDRTFPNELALMDAQGRYISQSHAFDTDVAGDFYINLLGLTVGNWTIRSTTWRDDYPATHASKGILNPGGATHGVINYDSDADSFKMSLEGGMFYQLQLTGDYDYYSMFVNDADGKPIADVTASNGGDGLALNFHPLTSGTYYLSASRMPQLHPLTGERAYNISLSKPVSDDVGDTLQTARTVAIGDNASATLQAASDIDIFKLDLPANARYGFSLQVADGAHATLELDDANGNFIGNYSTDNLGHSEWVRYSAATSGPVYLKVSNQQYGAHNYVLQTKPLSNDTQAPQLLASTHPDGATGIKLSATTIKLSFNEAVTIGRSAITVLNQQGRELYPDYEPTLHTSYPFAWDNTVVLKLSGQLLPGQYTIKLRPDQIKDIAGNAYAGPDQTSFTTVLPGSATAGADLLAGNTGGTIDGLGGIDTVQYAGSSGSYRISRSGNDVLVKNLSSDKSEVLHNIERLQFENGAYALDLDGHGGQAYRLYQAAFNRSPDAAGVGFWITQLDNGASLHEVAHGFVSSTEFQSLYGAAPDDIHFITLLYNNVLHRSPDSGGQQFWLDVLHNGASHEDLLTSFSESAENQAALASVIGNGFDYLPS